MSRSRVAVLASYARTALSDPHGLPDSERDLEGVHPVEGPTVAMRYAVELLDEIIRLTEHEPVSASEPVGMEDSSSEGRCAAPGGAQRVGTIQANACACAGHETIDWSESGMGQYGMACLDCKLFWLTDFHSKRWVSCRLDEAFFPRRYRGVPRYRALVGWVDAITPA